MGFGQGLPWIKGRDTWGQDAATGFPSSSLRWDRAGDPRTPCGVEDMAGRSQSLELVTFPSEGQWRWGEQIRTDIGLLPPHSGAGKVGGSLGWPRILAPPHLPPTPQICSLGWPIKRPRRQKKGLLHQSSLHDNMAAVS